LSVERNQDDLAVTEQHKLDDLSKWWHVNKGGFPIAPDTWDKMWYYVRQVHPESEQVEESIRGKLQAKVYIVSLTDINQNLHNRFHILLHQLLQAHQV